MTALLPPCPCPPAAKFHKWYADLTHALSSIITKRQPGVGELGSRGAPARRAAGIAGGQLRANAFELIARSFNVSSIGGMGSSACAGSVVQPAELQQRAPSPAAHLLLPPSTRCRRLAPCLKTRTPPRSTCSSAAGGRQAKSWRRWRRRRSAWAAARRFGEKSGARAQPGGAGGLACTQASHAFPCRHRRSPHDARRSMGVHPPSACYTSPPLLQRRADCARGQRARCAHGSAPLRGAGRRARLPDRKGGRCAACALVGWFACGRRGRVRVRRRSTMSRCVRCGVAVARDL